MRQLLRRQLPATFACALTCTFLSAALANHGPGASGGGSSTASGETLKQNHFELSLREDFTQFERFTPAHAAQRAAESGDFDALRRAYVTSLDLGYGITNDFQIGLNTGYFAGERFLSASRDEDTGDVTVAEAQPSGMTDLVLTGKYRVYRGWYGNVALLAGIKAPTGRTDVHLSTGEKLSPTDQPGTGAWDFPVGIAYSRFLTPKLTLDASAMYLIRTQHEGFQVGDRLDLGAALAYRLTDNINTFPQFAIFGETLMVYLQKDRDHGETDSNSGSATVYFSPGFRVRFTPNVALTIAPQIPLYQHVNGDQGKVEFKITTSLSFSF